MLLQPLAPVSSPAVAFRQIATCSRQRTHVRRHQKPLQRAQQPRRCCSWQHSATATAPRPSNCPQAAPDGSGGVEPVTLQQSSAHQLAELMHLLAQQVTAWLDEEWLPQDVHRDLGDAAAEARTLRTIAYADNAASTWLTSLTGFGASSVAYCWTPFISSAAVADNVLKSCCRRMQGSASEGKRTWDRSC